MADPYQLSCDQDDLPDVVIDLSPGVPGDGDDPVPTVPVFLNQDQQEDVLPANTNLVVLDPHKNVLQPPEERPAPINCL